MKSGPSWRAWRTSRKTSGLNPVFFRRGDGDYQQRERKPPVTVPAELLASLIQTAEQALWKREWAARDNGLAVPECVTRRQAVVNQARTLLKNNTHENN
ncbi:DUF1380 family protein [Escherichia coli]|uniref:DUF1380 family protein n=1 Tax=Escherichia coli TaxID=562 RepID=UPI0025A32B97|nr:DUF1380 family protein [Escherichia coli]